MSTDDNDAYGDLDKSNLKFVYEQFLNYFSLTFTCHAVNARKIFYWQRDAALAINFSLATAKRSCSPSPMRPLSS